MATHSMTTVYAFPVRTGAARPGLLAWLTQMIETRRTRHMLAEMDDRMLADIGLDRAQARIEADRPAWDITGRGW